jgi:hypothetical protein
MGAFIGHEYCRPEKRRKIRRTAVIGSALVGQTFLD